MKKVLLIALALTVCASAALADHIGVYSDTGGLSCALTTFVPFPGKTNAYVVHKQNGGATASQFKVVDLSGLAFAGITSTFLTIGNKDDLSVTYGGCLTGDLMLVTLEFYAFGGNFTCANTVSLAAAPTSPLPGEIALVLCDFETVEAATGGTLFVGPDAQNCVGPTGCDPIPVHETTWGGIKALYR